MGRGHLDSDLLREWEMEEVALPQHCLQNFDHFHRFRRHESGHNIKKFVHKAVMKLGQIGDEAPV